MEDHPKIVERSAAWGFLLTNLLFIPGLGSVLGGRKVGYLQMLLSLLGFLMAALWMFCLTQELLDMERVPPNGGSRLVVGLVGLLLFGIAWIWGLITGISMLRRARPPNIPPVLRPPEVNS